MSLYDSNTGIADNFAFSLDNHEVAAGNKSLFDSVSDVVTKGLPLAGLSMVNSFANTAIDLANFFNADIERYDPRVQLADNENMLNYYAEHELGVDVVGLIAGSLIPGTLAIKALKVAQAGKFGTNVARATNIFAGPRDDIVKGALAEIEAGNASLYGQINSDKLKAIAFGFGDQAMQAAAFELATLATMKASPILDDAGFNDVVSNMFFGVLLGSGVGGVIEGIGIRGTINKALLKQDLTEKGSQLATYLGRGNFLAGDRVAVLLASLDEIPEATTVGASKKAARTRDTAILNSKKILADITGSEKDQALSASFVDTLLKMRESGVGKEEMFDMLAGLGKISRVDSVPTIRDPDVFYFNSHVESSEQPLASLATNKAVPTLGGVPGVPGYKMRESATEIKIARFNDTVVWEGNERNLYAAPNEAFRNGADVFVDNKLKVHVNPDAPNIQPAARRGESRPLTAKEEETYRMTGKLPADSDPLLGAPLVLNVRTGEVTNRAYATVGDLARAGDLKLARDARGRVIGLHVTADRISRQDLKTGFVYGGIDTIDANARYVWAHMRGIQAGDKISTKDLPVLEQLYREVLESPNSAEKLKELTAKGVKLLDDSGKQLDLPESIMDIRSMLQASKDDIIKDLVMADNKIVDAADVAIRANVPVSYLENGLRAKSAADFMQPIEDSMKLQHVKLEYDVSNIARKDGQILRGMLDVQYRVQVVKQTLETASVDFFKERAADFKALRTAADADVLGAGASGVGFANAKYNTLAQEMEVIGKNTTLEVQRRRALLSDRISNEYQAIVNDNAAGAELGAIQHVLRRTNHRYVLPTADEAAAAKIPPNTMVLEKSIKRDETGRIIEWQADYRPEGFITGKAAKKGVEGRYTYYAMGDKTAAFLRTHTELNDARLEYINKFYAANGMSKTISPGALYAPPIDTAKFKHVALVRQPRGVGMASDEVSAITSDTAAGLEQKAAALRGEFQVVFKADTKLWHEALGDYEYGMNFAQQNVDNLLERRGILVETFPDLRGESVLKGFTDWHFKQETRLVRNYVELTNAQLFAELRAMGAHITAAETSKVGYLPSSFGKSVQNPYNSYIKTALGMSEKEEYRLWHEANEKLETFFDSAFRAAKQSFTAANKGLISYEQANVLTARLGLGNPYGKAVDSLQTYYEVANKFPPDKYLSKFVATANSVLSATAIRLDFFQSLINIVSTPVLLLSEANSAIRTGAQHLTTELPTSGVRVPAVSKLLYNAVGNYFDKSLEALHQTYRQHGWMRGLSSDYFQMIDNLTFPTGSVTQKSLTERASKAVEIGSKITGSNFAEEFTRFVAADVGRQIFEGAGYAGRQLTDNINTFVNRVHGNYIASQRPVAFQGPIGQAIGLFQTYQFNLMQQLFRHVENGDGKTIAILMGLQSTLFGFQGLPGFHAINSHIIGNASGNPTHNDAYNIVPQFMDKKAGDYLLYGVLSNWLNTGLYSRGDINPRQITILPTNPLDYPAISGGIRFINSLINTGKNIAGGGDVTNSLLLGLEHNGLSRPLAGISQMLQGYSTTGMGSLVSVTRPAWSNLFASSDLYSIASFSRLLGARPLDEAVIMDAMYRKTLYQAKDRTRIENLGSAVKTTLFAGASPDQEEVENFASRYANAGGRIENFGRRMIEWSRDANTSVANQLYSTLRSPLNRNMMTIMGGEKLPDFNTNPEARPASSNSQAF